ncbi:MAG: Uma2 family endonuclease [Okeania sp. SIO2F4]|uniref:Uma2 family endonuclease n=1 Tax=Okeania sp. SIO2F4 TaxID=2607790 RepID=UPI00142A0EE8|nr:Uma2 family endonuclease [Okeania sp. SIO2F4]NES06622.1 Uma2 family endonuclease [Okeania sp. SIO2F4]
MWENPIVLKIPSDWKITDDNFFNFCQINQDLAIETNKFGELLIMSPAGSETSNRNLGIAAQLYFWAETESSGIAFDSSAGFTLSTGAKKSPDVSWIKLERWNSLSQEQKEKFAPICPDFVVELMSPSDHLKTLQAKMTEYMEEPEIQLGWLIDRKERKVYIYCPGMTTRCLENPESISGEPILPGFVLNMSRVW